MLIRLKRQNYRFILPAFLFTGFFALFFQSLELPGQPVEQEGRVQFEQVLDSMQVHFEQIKDYRVTIHIVMDVKGIHIPPMLVIAYFKQPDKMQFESRGFAIFPRNAVMISPAKLRELGDKVDFAGFETSAKNNTAHFTIYPRVKDKNIEIRLDFWVDLKYYLIRKIRTQSNRFGWFEINNEFALINKKYWLPEKSNIKMKIDGTALNRFRAKMPFAPGAGNSPPAIFDNLFGTGQMFITFRNYKINTGIADDFFTSKEKK